VEDIYALAGDRPMQAFLSTGDDDFSFAIDGVSRFRVSVFKQRGTHAAIIRVGQLRDAGLTGS
jgi:twitching motility protein PilT